MDYRKAFDWTGVTDPITDEEVRAWVADLRSDKYEQGKEQLCNIDDNGIASYCCLGVANITFDLKIPGTHSTLRTYNEDESGDKYFKMPIDLQQVLWRLNDVVKMTFAEIADNIEKGFGLV